MKLYHFNNKSWGAEYFVMAENKIEAHKALLNHLDKEAKELIETYKDFPVISDDAYDEYNVWKDVNPEDPTTFPRQFTLDEYDKNIIIESENA